MAFPRSSRHISSRLEARLRGKERDQSSRFLGGLAAGMIGVTILTYAYSRPASHSVVLALDLSAPIPEVHAPSLLNLAGMMKPNHYDFLRLLHHASKDPKVAGIMANVSQKEPWNMAQAQEVRDASEIRDSNTNYYLASGFDRIYLQPCGDVNLLGYRLHSPFLRGVFDKLGIQPQFVQRKEYKNMPNMFTQKKFTKEHKENVMDILTGMYNTVAAGISQGRQMAMNQVHQLLSQGPFTAQEAQEQGLVDQLIYENEIIPMLKQHKPHTTHAAQPMITLTGTNVPPQGAADSSHPASPSSSIPPALPSSSTSLPDLLNPSATRVVRFDRYAQTALVKLNKEDALARASGAPKIALLYGIGTVTNHGAPGFGGGPHFHSSTLAKAIHNAVKDPRVQVILFRIDSPGGSYVAADTVHAALLEAKNRGKKIVVSMGSVAASGGYFAAAPADYIVANPTTLTGSIGVFGGKFALRKFLEDKLGMSFDVAQVGEGDNAGMYSMIDPWNASQLNKMNALMDRIYADFVSKVAAGRNMSLEGAEALAKGRVWTGEAAKMNGLVDECGGLFEAIQKCSQLIPYPHRCVIETIPRKKGVLQLLAQAWGGGDAENDDEPLFTSAPTQSAVSLLEGSGLFSNTVKDGTELLEAAVSNKLLSYLGGQEVFTGGMSMSAAHGVLGQSGLLDQHGKLSL